MQVGTASTHDSSINSKMPDASLRLSGQAGLSVEPSFLISAASVSMDSVSGLLQQLTTPQMANVIGGLLMDSFPPTAPAALELMQSAIDAVTAQDLPRALDTIAKLVVEYPKELDRVRNELEFASIRSSVDKLLQPHMTAARTEAEQKLSLAQHAFEMGSPRPGRDLGKEVPQILSVAQRLLDTDRHGNLLFAGNLAQYVISFYPAVGAAVQKAGSFAHEGPTLPQSPVHGAWAAFDTLFEQVLRFVASIRERVPPKLMLLAWFAVGLMSGLLTAILNGVFEVEIVSAALPLEIWGAGSVGLLGYGTYRRVQKA